MLVSKVSYLPQNSNKICGTYKTNSEAQGEKAIEASMNAKVERVDKGGALMHDGRMGGRGDELERMRVGME